METVKVDNQKLQLLNERISQTIEALNQVRMSAHSIQHTLAAPPQSYAQYGAYASPAFSQVQQPFYGAPYAQQAFMQPYAIAPHAVSPYSIPHAVTPYTTPFTATPYTTPFTATPYTTPFAANPYTTPFAANPYTTPLMGNPFTVNPFAVSPFAVNPFTSTPFTSNPFAVSPFTVNPFTSNPFTSNPLFGGIQQTTAPVASPLGAWSMPYVGNGISHTPWDPSSAMRTSHSIPLGQHPYSVTIS